MNPGDPGTSAGPGPGTRRAPGIRDRLPGILHPDETARWGAAAAAVVVTLATALTAVALIRSGAADQPDPAPAGPGADTAAPTQGTPTQGTLAVAAPPAAHTAMPESLPARLSIPAIGVDTGSVIELRRTTGGSMEVPGHAGVVGWLATTPTPGERGASVLTGHASFAAERGVFAGLTWLHAGHEIGVHRADGTEATFTVYRVERVPHHLALQRATAPTGHPDLRLLTTAGVFDRSGGDTGAVLVWARLTAVG